jgi:hypothetical protein
MFKLSSYGSCVAVCEYISFSPDPVINHLSSLHLTGSAYRGS